MVEAQVMHLPDGGDHHKHSHYQVVVGLVGEADIEMDGRHAHLDGAHACVLPTGITHDFRGNARNNVLVINYEQHLPALQEPRHPEYDFLHRFFDRPRQLTLDSTLQSLTHSCSAQLSRVRDNPSMQHYLAAGLVQCLGSALGIPTDSLASSVGREDRFDRARIDRYIEANLHRTITVEDLASCVCMSRSRFHELFRFSEGLTPHQYLLRARLERARALIESTGLPLWDISGRTGFCSQAALTNAMRKHLGLIPSQLQRPRFSHRRTSPV